MEREICPNCGKRGLEKLEIDPDFEWLIPSDCEPWGCLKCGQSFFKKEKEVDKI